MSRAGPKREAKKRANDEGTTTRHTDGRWQAALYQPDGTRKFLHAPTREEAHA
jgi:hypothetical protein